MSDPASLPAVLVAGLVLGLAFGATVHRTQFCTMGAIADLVLFGDARRARAWLLAASTAVIGTQAATAIGLVPHPAPAPFPNLAGWIGLVTGGLAFGFGMTRTGGCLSRCLVRAGGGSLKALFVSALVFAVTLACLNVPLAVPGAAASVPTLGAAPAPGSLTLGGILGLAIGFAGVIVCLADRRFRASPRDWGAGVILGGLVTLGWLATARFAATSDGGAFAQSINLAAAPAQALLWSATAMPAFGFAAMVALGTVVGAALDANLRGTWRLETFSRQGDLWRHLGGAALMGLGAALTGGCTIGHGVTGLSDLALRSAVATGAMVAGGVAGIRSLEAGGITPWLRGWRGSG